MAINIVMGPACSGKSSFIRNTFKNHTIIDLYNFQENIKVWNVESIMKSYINCRDALIQALKENKEVVLEHTLLRAIRREMYIKAIKEVSNEPINIYVLLPSKETLLEFSKKRHCDYTISQVEQLFNTLEIPVKEEGFDNIYIITPI